MDVDEHGELLRQALQLEANEIAPAPDGLERIRAAIHTRQGRRWPRLRLLLKWRRPRRYDAGAGRPGNPASKKENRER